MRKPAVHVVCHPDVKKWIHRLCERFARHLERASPPKYRVRVELCPAPAVKVDESGECGFGVFVARGPKCIIAVACDWLAYRRDGITREDAPQMILATFAHEWYHYEQCRDGKPSSHRGTERRMRTLLKGFGLSM